MVPRFLLVAFTVFLSIRPGYGAATDVPTRHGPSEGLSMPGGITFLTSHSFFLAGAAPQTLCVLTGRLDPYVLLIDRVNESGLGYGSQSRVAIRRDQSTIDLFLTASGEVAAVQTTFPDLTHGGVYLGLCAHSRQGDVWFAGAAFDLGALAELSVTLPVDRDTLDRTFRAYVGSAGHPEAGLFSLLSRELSVMIAPAVAVRKAIGRAMFRLETAPLALAVRHVHSVFDAQNSTDEVQFDLSAGTAALSVLRDGTFRNSSIAWALSQQIPLRSLGSLDAWLLGTGAHLTLETATPLVITLGFRNAYPLAQIGVMRCRWRLDTGFSFRELSEQVWGFPFPVYYVNLSRWR